MKALTVGKPIEHLCRILRSCKRRSHPYLCNSTYTSNMTEGVETQRYITNKNGTKCL